MAHKIIPEFPEKPKAKFKKTLVEWAHKAADHKGRYGISFLSASKRYFRYNHIPDRIPTIQRKQKAQRGKMTNFFPTEIL